MRGDKPGAGEQGGVALLTILGLVSLIGLMAYMMNRSSAMSAVMENGNEGNEEAYYIAEAGLENARWEIKQNCAWASGFTDKAFGSGTYTVTAAVNTDNTTSLKSTGTSGVSKETIQVRLTSLAPFMAKDTYIDQDHPDENSGDESRIAVDTSDSVRGLISFDLSTIPVTAVVSSATLELYLYDSSDDDTASIYRVTSEWVELEATWVKRKTGINWGTSGGDFHPTIEATLPSAGTGFKQADMTDLVRKWVDGTYANYGMILRENSDRDRFRSNEHLIASQRPKLTVVYTPC